MQLQMKSVRLLYCAARGLADILKSTEDTSSERALVFLEAFLGVIFPAPAGPGKATTESGNRNSRSLFLSRSLINSHHTPPWMR